MPAAPMQLAPPAALNPPDAVLSAPSVAGALVVGIEHEALPA